MVTESEGSVLFGANLGLDRATVSLKMVLNQIRSVRCDDPTRAEFYAAFADLLESAMLETVDLHKNWNKVAKALGVPVGEPVVAG